MRILLDENIPVDFAALLPGHDVTTVQRLGWSGVKNGELLRRVAGHCDVFVTMDRSLEFQHNIRALSFGVVVIISRSSRIDDLKPAVSSLLKLVVNIEPGTLESIRA